MTWRRWSFEASYFNLGALLWILCRSLSLLGLNEPVLAAKAYLVTWQYGKYLLRINRTRPSTCIQEELSSGVFLLLYQKFLSIKLWLEITCSIQKRMNMKFFFFTDLALFWAQNSRHHASSFFSFYL